MKKIFTAFLLSGLLFQSPAWAYDETFSDVSLSHDQYIAIEYLATIGTLEGYSDGTFKASSTINRAELMKVLVAGQGIEPDPNVYKNCFPDVTTDWYAKYVCYAEEQGWVDGYPDGKFLPGNTVNKVEAAKMIINGMGYEDALPESTDSSSTWLYADADVNAWYVGYTRVVKAWNLDLVGDYFYPSDGMTRGLVAQYMFRITATEELGITRYEDSDGEDFLTAMGMDYILEAETTGGSGDDDDDEVWLNIEHDDGLVTIENLGDVDADLSGYTLETYDEVLYELSGWLDAGESVEVYVDAGGDTVYLHGAYGEVIDSDF